MVEAELAYVRARLGTIQSFPQRATTNSVPGRGSARNVTAQCPLYAKRVVIFGSVPGPLSCRICHHTWLSAEITAAGFRPGIHVAQC